MHIYAVCNIRFALEKFLIVSPCHFILIGYYYKTVQSGTQPPPPPPSPRGTVFDQGDETYSSFAYIYPNGQTL